MHSTVHADSVGPLFPAGNHDTCAPRALTIHMETDTHACHTHAHEVVGVLTYGLGGVQQQGDDGRCVEVDGVVQGAHVRPAAAHKHVRTWRTSTETRVTCHTSSTLEGALRK